MLNQMDAGTQPVQLGGGADSGSAARCRCNGSPGGGGRGGTEAH